MKRPTFLLLLLLICALTAKAYDQDQDKLKGYELNLSGGLQLPPITFPAWTLEPEIVWRFYKYLGLSLGMEITRQYGATTPSTIIGGYPAELCSNENDVGWLIFKPDLVVRSPYLWSNPKDEKYLWLEVSGGLSLSCPFRNSLTFKILEYDHFVSHTIGYKTFPNKGLRWINFNTKIQLKISLDRLILGAGYSWSDLDYYSSRRNVTLETGEKFRVPNRQMYQSVFLLVGYKF